MELRILAFGIAKEIFGSRTIRMNVHSPSVKSLMQELEKNTPSCTSCHLIGLL
jgi:hypothetical protein